MTYTDISCKNCGNRYSGRFCNICGQKASTHRMTWKEIFHYLPHAFLHLGEGFFFSLKELAKRPGHAIREYLEGKRQSHYNPFLMLLILAGLCSYLLVFLKLPTILASVEIGKLEIEKPVIGHKFFAIRNIFFCIICSVGDYLFFYKKKYALPEMLVANVFLFCGITALQLLFMPFFILCRYLGVIIYAQLLFIAIVLVYMFVARYQFFNAKGNGKLIAKIILALVTYLIIFFVVGRQIVKPFLSA